MKKQCKGSLRDAVAGRCPVCRRPVDGYASDGLRLPQHWPWTPIKNLSPKQLEVLRRLAMGDRPTMSSATEDCLLLGGYIDAEWALTPKGREAVEYAKRIGGDDGA